MDMEFIVPGITAFKEMLEDRQTEHEREAWQLGDYIPSTYLQDGVRKIYVWDADVEVRYTYSPTEGLKQLKGVF
jgi:hypothetical protein